MKLALKYYGLSITWALFVLVICSVKFGDIGSGHLFFLGFDKVTHCGLFFTLVVLYCYGFIGKNGTDKLTYPIALLIIITAIIYGAIIELLQAYVFTWRSGEMADLFCDGLGACMAAFSIVLFKLAIKKYVKA